MVKLRTRSWSKFISARTYTPKLRACARTMGELKRQRLFALQQQTQIYITTLSNMIDSLFLKGEEYRLQSW